MDFTRDYEAIKQAIAKIEHYDKTCMENMLQAVKSILLSNWGSQNHSQVLVFTDCGIGFGPKSLRTTIATLRNQRDTNGTVGTPTTMCLPFTFTSKLSFMCIGQPEDPYFRGALVLFQELLDVSGQKGELFVPADIGSGDNNTCSDATKKLPSLSASVLRKLVTRMCETNYKPFEAMLKCGGYARLECAVSIWPPPTVRFATICIWPKNALIVVFNFTCCRSMSIRTQASSARSSAQLKSAVTWHLPISDHLCPSVDTF